MYMVLTESVLDPGDGKDYCDHSKQLRSCPAPVRRLLREVRADFGIAAPGLDGGRRYAGFERQATGGFLEKSQPISTQSGEPTRQFGRISFDEKRAERYNSKRGVVTTCGCSRVLASRMGATEMCGAWSTEIVQNTVGGVDDEHTIGPTKDFSGCSCGVCPAGSVRIWFETIQRSRSGLGAAVACACERVRACAFCQQR